MAYRPSFFVGRIVLDGQFAEFEIKELNLAWPKVIEPLKESETRDSALRFCGGNLSRVSTWDISFRHNQMVFCEFYDTQALRWLHDLASSKSLSVIDGGTMRVIPLSEPALLAGATS